VPTPVPAQTEESQFEYRYI